MMKRKIAGLLLAVTMAVGMTGCAGSSNTGTAAPAGNQTEAAAKEEPSANQPKEESGDTIKIGFYGPLTGASSVVGVEGQKAVELAVKEANEAGGINGRQL